MLKEAVVKLEEVQSGDEKMERLPLREG